MKTSTTLIAGLLSAGICSACAVQPRTSSSYRLTPPARMLATERSPYVDLTGRGSTLQEVNSRLKRMYPATGKPGAVIYVDRLRNETVLPTSFSSEFGGDSHDTLAIVDQLTDGTSILSIMPLDDDPLGLYCKDRPDARYEVDRDKRLFIVSTIANRDDFWRENRSIGLFGESGDYSADGDTGVGSDAVRFTVWVSLRDCANRNAIHSDKRELEVFRTHTSWNAYLSNLYLGSFAMDFREEDYGLNRAKQRALEVMLSDLLTKGLPNVASISSGSGAATRTPQAPMPARPMTPQAGQPTSGHPNNGCAGNSCTPSARITDSDFCAGFKQGYKSVEGDTTLSVLCPVQSVRMAGQSDFAAGWAAGVEAATPAYGQGSSMLSSPPYPSNTYQSSSPQCLNFLLQGDVVNYVMCN